MTQPQSFNRLREPLEVNGCTIPNRIVRTAHATGYAAGTVTEQLIAYHEARARGGVGLVFLEIAGVHRTSPGSINLYRSDVTEGLSALVERVHAHGTKVFQQLWHGGPNAHARMQPIFAASDVPEPMNGRIPVPMSQAVIDEVVESFATAALRCKEAGLDGVEIHGAHGYLICSFLSPATNLRTDAYGGSTEKRSRFAEEVLGAIRSSVGSDYPVGIRLSATEGVSGGLEPPETTAIALRLQEQGLVDFVNVSIGNYYTFPKFIGAMHEPLGYQLPWSSAVTTALDVPTIVSGRIMDLHDADRLVADGIADLVSMVRATIADPELVRKSFEGRPEQVRPCLSCNQGCIGGIYGDSRQLGCVVNPEAGREARTSPLRSADSPRRVLVVGGGPAGLEAAWTAAIRGHNVILCEAADRLGGQVELARRAPHRQDIAAITDWLANELKRLGVDVRTGTLLDDDDITAIDADEVIIATGSEVPDGLPQRFRPGLDVPGADLAHVVTAADVLAGQLAHEPAHALVFDDIGDIAAVSVAEYLLDQGTQVTFVTSLPALAPALGASLQRDPARARLVSRPNFELLTRRSIQTVTPSTVTLQDLDEGPETEVPADLVVVSLGAAPRRHLYDSLHANGTAAQLIGDALYASDIQNAIVTGRRAGTSV